MGIHAFFVEAGDGGGCVLEGNGHGGGRGLGQVSQLLLLVLGLRGGRRLLLQLGGAAARPARPRPGTAAPT